MSTSVDTTAIDCLIADAREVFTAFRAKFLTDAFVADPYQDLENLRRQTEMFRDAATKLGLKVFAEIVRCLESSLEGLIQNQCDLSDSLLILIRVAEDALDGHTANEMNVPALVQRANIEYRRMRSLPKHADSRTAKPSPKGIDFPSGALHPEPAKNSGNSATGIQTPSNPDEPLPLPLPLPRQPAVESVGNEDRKNPRETSRLAVNATGGEQAQGKKNSTSRKKKKSSAKAAQSETSTIEATPAEVKAIGTPTFQAEISPEIDFAAELLAGLDSIDSDLDSDNTANRSLLEQNQADLEFPVASHSTRPPTEHSSRIDPTEDNELAQVFIEEVTDHCRQLGEILSQLHVNPGDLTGINDARRHLHSVKGSAGVMGWHEMARLSHWTEDLLERLANGTFAAVREAIDLLQCCVDALSEMLSRNPCGDLVELIAERFNELGLPDPTRADGPRPTIDPSATAPESDIAPDSEIQSRVKEPTPSQTNPVSSQPVIEKQQATLNANFISPNEDHDLTQVFIEEVSDHIRQLGEILIRLQANPADAGGLNDARRCMHSVKGSASVMGWQDMARLSHRTEDLLERLAAGTIPAARQGIDLLQCCVDVLGELLSRAPCEELLELIDEQFNEFGLTDSERTESGRTDEDLNRIPRTDSQDVLGTGNAADHAPKGGEIRDSQAIIDAQEVELDRLDDISPEMREIFTEEAEDHLRVIYAAFAGVEANGPSVSLIREIRRSVHTLKGAAGAVGFRVVSQWGHRMEDILDRLHDAEESASAETIALLYRTTDAIQDLVHCKCDQAELRQRLARLLVDFEAYHAEESLAGRKAPVEFDVSQRIVAPKGATKKEIKVDVNLVDFEAVANSARAVRARTTAPKQSLKVSNQPLLRVPIERLDALAQTVSELVINRTAFEQKMVDLIRFVAENQASVQRLRGISYNLESEYGVKLLGGQRHFMVGTAAPSVFQNKKITNQPDEFDSLEFDRYGEFHVLTRSLAETTTDIDTVGNELRSLLGDFDTLLNRQGRLAREAQTRIMGIRMVPLSTLATRLHRTVRVVAQEQNKNVTLEIHGEHVELDKLVLEEISDPLLHILRNAVDHGIETPAVREANGKPARATIRILAFHQGTQVVLQIQDDGRGLDYEKIRAKAIQNGVLSATEADCSTEEDLRQLIYVPGFSTASQVSEISGRGVGMDVVRDKVQKLKGTIEISSKPGHETCFTIRLPMTMAITRALLISVNQRTFALPIQVVQQILRIEKKELNQLDEDSVIRIKDKVYPVIRLSDRLNLRQRADLADNMVPTLLVSAGGRTAAIVVDRIIASQDIVVKTLGNHLQYLPGLIGATLMGDGTVIPILDAVDLVGVRTGRIHAVPTSAPVAVEEPIESNPVDRAIKVMIVDDSVSVRRVMSNLVKNAGMIPIVAKDGVDALGMLQTEEQIPDIFLLDIEMPRMDGFELLATLRGQQQYHATPIVMITSRAGDKHRMKAADLGASEYLTKPFRDQELLDTIRTLSRHDAMALA